MLNAANKTELVLALVTPNTLATPMKVVDQNVFSTLIVRQTKPVFVTSVRIHVQELVVKMQIAKL